MKSIKFSLLLLLAGLVTAVSCEKDSESKALPSLQAAQVEVQ